ncbi:MAG TPA: serine/threonine-protein kinase [Planctomycetota bacterium]
MATPLTVLIVSDEAAACERLRALTDRAGFQPVIEAQFEGVTDAVRRNEPKAALLFWRGGRLSALLVGRLMNLWPLPVLAFEDPQDLHGILRARRADAYDVLSTDAGDDEILARLQEAVREGERLRGGGRPRLGPYEIGEMLGRGGGGSVYAAQDLEHDRPVAIKILHPDHAYNADYIARFTREATSAGRLDHPNLMKVFDAGRARGRVYIAMERVHGRPLDIILRDEGAIDPVRSLRLARQIAAGLMHAHGMGLLHRDIKPSNVIVDDKDRVKLLDFGLLKPAVEEHTPITRADEFIGTLQYSAPERLRGEKADARCDIYSLGVVLYEMLTGLRPHPGSDSNIVAQSVASGCMPVPIQEVRPSVDDALAIFVQLLLAPTAAARPSSAAKVVDTIDRILARRKL